MTLTTKILCSNCLRRNKKKGFLMNGLCSVIAIVLMLGVSACNTSRIASMKDVSTRTDYVEGEIYILQKPAFLFKHLISDPNEVPIVSELGFAGTALNVAEFQKESLGRSQVVGLLLPGDRVRIKKFIDNKFFNIGHFLDVIAVVESGEQSGLVVELSMISKERGPSYDVFVDSEYLKLAEK